MIKFELLKANQEALVDKITSKHLKSVIDVIKEASHCPTLDGYVEFKLSETDARALLKGISTVVSKLEIGVIAGVLWEAYDCINEYLLDYKWNK
jgi:hypothetical protein